MAVSEHSAPTDAGAPGGGLPERLAALERRVSELEQSQPDDKLAMVVFSGDLDRVLAGFVIAAGAAAMGQRVDMFFTFWGLTALKQRTKLQGKSFLQKMMSVMTPGNSRRLPASKMNFFGVGAQMLRAMMKQRNVSSLEELMNLAREMGVNIIACDMSQDVMGIRDDELIDGLSHGGVGTFLGSALRARASLFI
jgi:peroxiredoxin family protein